ncbi:MAG: hypothetical protein ABW208_10290 [Pyrinomonadaceae bacterium]
MSDPNNPGNGEVDPSESTLDEGAEQQGAQASEGDGEDSEVADNAQAAE